MLDRGVRHRVVLMIQLPPQLRVLVAVEPVDFRRGIDGLAQICRAALGADPLSGTVFAFRNRRGSAIRLLVYDGWGYWLCYKRLSKGRFHHWPTAVDSPAVRVLAHELQVLLSGGDPVAAGAAPLWRRVDGGN